MEAEEAVAREKALELAVECVLNYAALGFPPLDVVAMAEGFLTFLAPPKPTPIPKEFEGLAEGLGQ
jgi:hypothetical protein